MKGLSLEAKIKLLIDLHDMIQDCHIRADLEDHRSDLMKFYVENQLVDLGHSLKGMWGLSSLSKGSRAS